MDVFSFHPFSHYSWLCFHSSLLSLWLHPWAHGCVFIPASSPHMILVARSSFLLSATLVVISFELSTLFALYMFYYCVFFVSLGFLYKSFMMLDLLWCLLCEEPCMLWSHVLLPSPNSLCLTSFGVFSPCSGCFKRFSVLSETSLQSPLDIAILGCFEITI